MTSAQKLFPFPIETLRLDNGLTVMFVSYDSPGLAAYYSLVRTGSRNEVEPGRSGFAHFFEHMMFRGTEKYPKEAYDQLLSKAGISNNAFTTDDFTAYHAFGPSAQLPLVIELEADRFQNLKYAEDDFRTEAKAVLGEYLKNFSNPGERIEEVLRDTAFTTHTYKHTTMGFKEDIEAMPGMYEYSLEFFRRWYTPDNTTLVVVGDFDKAQVEALIRKHYAGWKRQSAKLAIPTEPKQSAAKAVHVSWANPTQPRVTVAWHTPGARPDTRDAALQNVLGPYLFGPTSPMYQDLVLERQLVVGMGSQYWDHRDPYLFSFGAVLKDDQGFKPVREALDKALAELRAGKVDLKRFEDVKSNQRYGVTIGPTGEPDALDALFQHMAALTPEDLVTFAILVEANETAVTLTGAGAKAPAGAKEYVPAVRGKAVGAKGSKGGGR